jgi:tetratricopeptide (TPR) repeat protein
MRLFLTATFLLVGLVVGCSSEADYLELTWMEFDQDPDGGWRPLAHAGDYAGAAKMIEIYLAHHRDLPDAQRGYSTLHAGQLLALNGETDRAIAFFEKAVVAGMPPEFPQTFNALVAGELSFLQGDMAGVRAARDEAAAMPGLTMRDSMFIESLGVLLESEGKTYRQVFDEAVEE